MAQKDGYQQYLDQAAAAANAVGASHHDPAVRARQGMLNGGLQPPSPQRKNHTPNLGHAAQHVTPKSAAKAPSQIGYAEAAEIEARRKGHIRSASMLIDAVRAHEKAERVLGNPSPALPGTKEAELETNSDYRNWVWNNWFKEVSPIEAVIGEHHPEVGFTHYFKNSNGFTRSRDMTSAEVLAYLEKWVGKEMEGFTEAIQHLRNGSAVRHFDRLLRTQHSSYPGIGKWKKTQTRRAIISAAKVKAFNERLEVISRQRAEWRQREKTIKVSLALLVALITFLIIAALL